MGDSTGPTAVPAQVPEQPSAQQIPAPVTGASPVVAVRPAPDPPPTNVPPPKAAPAPARPSSSPAVTAPQFPAAQALPAEPSVSRAFTPLAAPAAPSLQRSLTPGGSDLLLGTVIDGRYRVLDRLGSGGMGTVYGVMHERMNKGMALKVLHPRLSQDPVVRARFRREARAASLLESRHTVAVFDFGETPDGLLYLAMELLRGKTLSALLKERGVLSPGRTSRILGQVLKSLEEAHSHGIVHRDIKPDNVFLLDSEDGEGTKVLDFGIAKGTALQDVSASHTRSDLVVGTPEYMAPEQARGAAVDGRADLWAVGVMLYECLTGTLPFAGPSAVDIMVAVMDKQPLPPAEGTVPPAFQLILLKALQKKAVDRYQTAAEMRLALQDAAQELLGPSQPLTPQPSAPPEVVRRPPQDALKIVDRDEWEQFARAEKTKKRLMLGGAGALGVTLFGALVLALLPSGPVSQETEPNNAAAAANLVEPGNAVRGSLAPPQNGEADEDFYVFDLPAGPHMLNATVTPTGNPANLGVTVWVDNKAVFQGYGSQPRPRVGNLMVEGGRVFLRVREELPTSDIPPSPAPIGYRLDVKPLRAPEPNEEREPNDSAATALSIQEGQQLRGLLVPGDDQDWYRVPAPPEDRELTAEVVASEGAAVELAFYSSDGKRVGRKVGKPGERVRLSVTAKRCGAPCALQVQPSGADTSDASYTLTVR